MTCKCAPKAHVLSVVSLLIKIFVILIALAGPAQLMGGGRPPTKRAVVLTPQDASPPLFLPAVLYDSGGGAVSVAVADVNGDGKPDLLVANYNSGTVGVLLGNGDGTFQSATTFDAGGPDANTFSIAVADLNADGKPDIIVIVILNTSQHAPVHVLLGNGDGTFQPAVAYRTGLFNAYTVVAADVNGDNKLDLVVTNEFVVNILLGSGDGTFQAAVPYGTGGNFADSGVVADINGDGKLDVIVSNKSGGVGVLLGIGDGTFQPAVTYGSDAFWTTVGDVNGDGKPDLVFVNSRDLDDGEVRVLFGNGDGTFRSGGTYDAGGIGSWKIAMADINGDGKPDLLVANRLFFSESVTVLLGNGDGTFQAALSFKPGGDPWSIAVADLNGDNKPDLVVADLSLSDGSKEGGVGVLMNNKGDTTPPVITVSATPRVLWPPNGKMVPVTVSGTISDTGSGVNVNSAAYVVKDEYGEVQPKGTITLGPGGNYSFIVLLQASRLGHDLDGRRYTVTVQAKDNAGDDGSKTSVVLVPHDR
jgi:hypothetical protein